MELINADPSMFTDATVLDNIDDLGRAEWEQRRSDPTRKTWVGASDIGAIAGLNRYRTARDVWADRMNPPPRPDMHELPDALRCGIGFEAAILDMFAEDQAAAGTGHVMRTPWTMQSIHDPCMIASPDGLYVDTTGTLHLIEIKNVGAAPWQSPPPQYVAQCQWQMLVTGVRSAVLVVVHRGNIRAQYWLGFDQVLADSLVDAAAAFRSAVVFGEEPAAMAAADLSAPDSDAGMLIVDRGGEVHGLAARYNDAKVCASEWDAKAKALREQLLVAVDGHTGAADTDGEVLVAVSWRRSVRKRPIHDLAEIDTAAWDAISDRTDLVTETQYPVVSVKDLTGAAGEEAF